MTSQRLQFCDLDSDSNISSDDIEIVESTVPKNSSGTIRLSNKSDADDQLDDDEIVSPRKNRHSVLLSDDEEEHLVRLDLHEQAREEQLESLINLGVAERRHPVPDRMRTVVRVIDGRQVSCVEPANSASDEDREAGAKETDVDVEAVGMDEETAGEASENTNYNKYNEGDSRSSNEDDKVFIVSDSATPSYHDSAGPSSSSDEADCDTSNNSVTDKADKSSGAPTEDNNCQCQCQCPACRRCEFKCRKRWRRKHRKTAAIAAAAAATAMQSGSSDDGEATGNLQHRADKPTTSMHSSSQKRKRLS